MFSVYITPRGEKDLGKLPEEASLIISKEIQVLEKNPFPEGNKIKKIRRPFNPVRFELKVKDYRVIFAVLKQRVIVGRIIHRKDLELALKKMAGWN